MFLHQCEQRIGQFGNAGSLLGQAELGCHGAEHGALQRRLVGVDGGNRVLFVFNQWQQCLAQAEQVPVGDLWLAREGVAAAAVAVVADVVGVVMVEKLERAVVDGQAQQTHVVGVHHAMAKADGLPLGDHARCALGYLFEQGGIALGRAAGMLGGAGKVALDHVIGQCAQVLHLVASGEMLKMAKAHKAGRYAGYDGGGFHRLAVHRLRRSYQRQRSRGGDAQRVHGFAAQVFADGRAQHRAAIAHARVRRHASAFELQLLPLFLPGQSQFTEQNGAAIAQLTSPLAELVAAVDRGHGVHARQKRIAAEHLCCCITVQPAFGQAHVLGQAVVVGV